MSVKQVFLTCFRHVAEYDHKTRFDHKNFFETNHSSNKIPKHIIQNDNSWPRAELFNSQSIKPASILEALPHRLVFLSESAT